MIFRAMADACPEDRLYILHQFQKAAVESGQKIILSPIILDYAEVLFDPVFFRALCEICDCSKLNGKTLLQALIHLDQVENLAYALKCSAFKVSKKGLQNALDYAQSNHHVECTTLLMEHLQG